MINAGKYANKQNDTIQEKVFFFVCISACLPGKLGLTCSEDCPMGYYGLSCVEVCQCSLAECDKAFGCLIIGNYTLNQFESWKCSPSIWLKPETLTFAKYHKHFRFG